jgi:hypothetical protein
LIGVAAIFTLTVAAEVRYDVAGPADDADPPQRADTIAKLQRNDGALTLPITVDDRLILSRPLFAPSRRPQTEQPPAVLRSRDDGLPRLTGIVINGPIRLAIFQPKSPEKAIVIGVGDAIEGEKIMAISARDVVIADRKGERHLQPVPDASIKPVSTGVPAPPPRFIQPTTPQARGIPRPRGGVNFGK